jgi:hypothetical protein
MNGGVTGTTQTQNQAVNNAGHFTQTVVNAGTNAAVVVNLEPDSLPNVAGTTHIL